MSGFYEHTIVSDLAYTFIMVTVSMKHPICYVIIRKPAVEFQIGHGSFHPGSRTFRLKWEELLLLGRKDNHCRSFENRSNMPVENSEANALTLNLHKLGKFIDFTVCQRNWFCTMIWRELSRTSWTSSVYSCYEVSYIMRLSSCPRNGKTSHPRNAGKEMLS